MKESKGKFETLKFESRRESFYEYLEWLRNEKKIEINDFMEHFPAYIGHMSLNRLLTLYELYKKTLGLAGHVAEVGVYKGAGTLLFAKLIKIFEPEALTQVHGFDWFKGTGEKSKFDNDLVEIGSYSAEYADLNTLISKQELNQTIHIHNLDLTKDLESFFGDNPHLQFKLIFLDIGMYDVLDKSIPIFWERLNSGGVMIFDQYNHELAPGETKAINKHLKNIKIQTIINSWMPNCYVVKP
jgi:predicted O-methyltransferase YrrM